MPVKGASNSNKKRGTTKKTASENRSKKRNTAKTKKNGVAYDSSEQRFVRDLLIRGEAAKPSPEGELPPGSTHKIVDANEKGLSEVERERFSAW